MRAKRRTKSQTPTSERPVMMAGELRRLEFFPHEHRLFRRVMEVQSVSRNTTTMRRFIKDVARECGATAWSKDGNVYVVKGRTAQYPCMVAHTDTVHELIPQAHFTVARSSIGEWWAYDNSVWEKDPKSDRMNPRQVGIGGDDKVGVYIALLMLMTHDTMKCAFFRDEEIGCIGARAADMAFFDDVTLALECDRRGMGDFVDRIGGTALLSKDFEKAIAPIIKESNFSPSSGAMTDVLYLKEQGLKVSCANMSCGYYNPHGRYEYCVEHDVVVTQMMVDQIVRDLGDRPWPHIYEKPVYTYTGTRTQANTWRHETVDERQDRLKESGFVFFTEGGYWAKPPADWPGWGAIRAEEAARATAQSATSVRVAPRRGMPPITPDATVLLERIRANPTGAFARSVEDLMTIYAPQFPDLDEASMFCSILEGLASKSPASVIDDILRVEQEAVRTYGIPKPASTPIRCEWCDSVLLKWDFWEGAFQCQSCFKWTEEDVSTALDVAVAIG